MEKLAGTLGKKLLIFDGGMGTMLQAAGLLPGESPDLWNLTHPEKVKQVHAAYLNAGAQVVTANTFGSNRWKAEKDGPPVRELVRAGVFLAKEALKESGRGWAALDMGPTGKLLKPLGDLDFEDAVESFREVAEAGAAAGADCVLIETMSDIYEAKAAVLAAKENTNLPVIVTMTFDENGKLLTGGDLAVMAAVLEGLGVDALGLNCGLGPRQMVSLTKKLRGLTALPIVVMPNAGLPREEDGRTVYDVGPESFASCMEEIVKAGACGIGGCCGTTPQHIRAVVRHCGTLSWEPPAGMGRTVVSSGLRTVELGKIPVIIGERINPTGKPRFKQALRDNDLPYVLSEGIAQQDAGAHVLDVNVGLPEIDETAVMCKVVRELQAVTPLPLQIDTSSPETMQAAMRVYNGKPLVNSVTAKKASMEAVFPLVKKYGGVVVGLTITEEGIPDTAEGRLEAARRIVDTAARYGIEKRDVVIDPLTMSVSAGQDAALVTLKALRLIRETLGVCVSLGVSNVSFGLPRRENMNAAFFLMALENGLDAAIMNPKSESMMGAYRSYRALTGSDESCMEYIAAYTGQPAAGPAQAQTQYTLEEAIQKGLKEAAFQAAEQLLGKGSGGLEVIEGHIVPALDQVGERFEAKTLFLPQLLMSAEAAKAAFNAVRERMKGTDGEKRDGFKIVLATVRGDVHDIGKNIVKVLLENYGFSVIDLGKDVPPEAVLEAVIREKAKLVGLSALMTTTVPAMAGTIALLRDRAPDCKVMVGGAVLTQEYADQIGADFYGKDAMASVRYALALEERETSR